MLKSLLSLALAGSVIGFRTRKPFPTHFIDAEIVTQDPAADRESIDDTCATCVHRFDTHHNCLTGCAYLLAALDRLKVPTAAAVTVQVQTAPVLRPPLPADESATAFVDWLRREDRCGEYTFRELHIAYRQFCGIDRRRPCADNTLRRALRSVPGVSSAVVRVAHARTKRERHTVWTIQPEETVSPSFDLAETFDYDARKAA